MEAGLSIEDPFNDKKYFSSKFIIFLDIMEPKIVINIVFIAECQWH